MRTGWRLTLVALAVIACGGDDDDGGPTGPNGSDGTMTATVSGASGFAATSVVGAYASNVLVVTALQVSGGTSRSIVITLNNVTGASQYSVTAAGNSAQYIETSSTTPQSWLAAITQGSGNVTLTTATATRVIGSFSFTAPALSGGATGTKTVSGQFDIVPSNPN